MAKLYFKRIPLLPTDFEVDVWVCEDKMAICRAAVEMYGETIEHFEAELEHEMACRLIDKAGTNRMVIFLMRFDPAVIAHEAIHTSWQLNKFVNYNYSYRHHEIQAYLVEYILKEAMKMKSEKSFYQKPA